MLITLVCLLVDLNYYLLAAWLFLLIEMADAA